LMRQFGGPRKAEDTAVEELIRDIRSKSRVDELSRNPLICTTLVLVYKYGGARLPERRVDVYHQVVNLMLGFWETHRAERECTVDVDELVLIDGTRRLTAASSTAKRTSASRSVTGTTRTMPTTISGFARFPTTFGSRPEVPRVVKDAGRGRSPVF
jgi:hypothetical protein